MGHLGILDKYSFKCTDTVITNLCVQSKRCFKIVLCGSLPSYKKKWICFLTLLYFEGIRREWLFICAGLKKKSQVTNHEMCQW